MKGTMTKSCRRVFRPLAVFAVLFSIPAAFGQAPKECADAPAFKSSGGVLSITKTERVPASAPGTLRTSPAGQATVAVAVPSFCRVDGVIDRRKGVDGKSYGIGFALALPEPWNGDFLFQGGGGLNGNVAFPLGAQAAGDTPALVRGFAVVTTDTGHQSTGAFDGGFFSDQQASLDFYYQAIGRVGVLAKEMVAWYYGRPAAHSYYDGCSTGGREAMIMSQRYPSYFDGIISGDPAIRTGYSNLALGFIESVFAQAAPKDAAGNGQASMLFTDADRKLITNSLLAACDAKDGLKDGMIFNTRDCNFDPAALTCSASKTDQCLTASEVAALKKAFAGPKTLHGDPIYPGFPYDAGIADQGGLPGLLFGPRIPVRTGAAAPADFDVDREAARVASNPAPLTGDSTWTNLSTFAGHGGKLLFYHGLSDPWFSPLDTLGYYEKMAQDTVGQSSVNSWSRIYLVPGMGHCQGGSSTLDRFDMLTAIVNWVEKSEAPGGIVATGRAFPGRSRPLCPYPQHTQYLGQGDPNDAKNFACRE